MQTRSSQRLAKIRSDLRGEPSTVEQKKEVNEKVKAVKAHASKAPKMAEEKTIYGQRGLVSSKKEQVVGDLAHLPQSDIETQTPDKTLKVADNDCRPMLQESLDPGDSNQFARSIDGNQANFKPQLDSIKVPPVLNTKIDIESGIDLAASKNQLPRVSLSNDIDDLEAMLTPIDKLIKPSPISLPLSQQPSNNSKLPPDPLPTPTTTGHLPFKSEDFVTESKHRVEDVYFFIKPPLGSGMFGTVYKAKHKKTGVTRAIKRIKKDLRSPKSIEALLKDVEILKTLDHPNIIKVYEYFQDDAAVYVVTELCTGGELFEQILKEKNFSEQKAADLMRQMLSAIAYCHERRLAHCDLKPENIIFESQTAANLIKIIDFGNSAFLEGENKLTNRFGSVYYVAPEVLLSSYTEQCDVWSLGVILFLILSGKPPFNGANDQIILKKVYEGKYSMDGPEWSEVSDDAKDLVGKMLIYDFKKRFTARQCLEHRWIKVAGKVDSSRLNQPVGRRSLRNLRTFKAESKMQEAIMYFIVNQLMTKDEQEDLMNAFMSLDTDHDGKLTRADLVAAYVKVGEDPETVNRVVDEVLANIDKTDKGFIDYSEYLTASLSKRRMFSEERLVAAFQLFDTNDQGFITVNDFKAMLNKGAFAQVDEALWAGLINEVTGDSDKMDFEAFRKMVTMFTKNEQVTQSLALV